jgi:hypothetical protein
MLNVDGINMCNATMQDAEPQRHAAEDSLLCMPGPELHCQNSVSRCHVS